MTQLIRIVALACALSGTALASQEPGEKPRPGEKPPTKDAPFIGTAAMDGLAEVEHGRLAAQNASSAEVKQFAQRMVDDHSKAGEELKGMAAKKDVALAPKLDRQHREMHDALAKLKSTAFDQAYMAHMVKAHLEAVTLFQQEAKAGQDADLKAWAAKTLPTLQEHLKMASSINAKVNKPGK